MDRSVTYKEISFNDWVTRLWVLVSLQASRQKLMVWRQNSFFSNKPQFLIWKLLNDWMRSTHINKGNLLKVNWLKILTMSAFLLSCFSHVQLSVTSMDCSPPDFCPQDAPGENTGVGCRVFLQVNFPTEGLSLSLLYLPVLAGRFVTTAPHGKPINHVYISL